MSETFIGCGVDREFESEVPVAHAVSVIYWSIC